MESASRYRKRQCLEALRARSPADVIRSAVKVMKIAAGEDADEATDDGKDKAAQSLGLRGGNARAKALSKRRRADIAEAAAAKRWGE